MDDSIGADFQISFFTDKVWYFFSEFTSQGVVDSFRSQVFLKIVCWSQLGRHAAFQFLREWFVIYGLRG